MGRKESVREREGRVGEREVEREGGGERKIKEERKSVLAKCVSSSCKKDSWLFIKKVVFSSALSLPRNCRSG